MQPFVNPFAAVPSLHVGWSLLLAAGVFVSTRNLLLRLAAIAVFVLQSISVVGTGNHYIFDGVVGLVVCAVALGAAVWLQRRGYPALGAVLARRAGLRRPAEQGRAEPRPAPSRPGPPGPPDDGVATRQEYHQAAPGLLSMAGDRRLADITPCASLIA